MPWSDNLPPGSPAFDIASSENARVRVVAGPGTGKSFAMKRRVARLLESGVSPAAILPVTFTKVAAEDLHRELIGMNVQGCNELLGRTLHSLAFRVLMDAHAIQATGRTPRPLNDFELKPLEADLGALHGGKRIVRKRMKAFEAAWARLQSDEPGYVQSAVDAALETGLVDWLKFHRAMLVGEVIPLVHRYLRDNPAAPIRSEFAHILVDEYQDLNKAEQGVIKLLGEQSDVCIVGDDDQSIYSFKHAHPDGIRQWLQENAGAADLELLECRRCPTRVVEMSNALIVRNLDRPMAHALNPRPQNGPGEIDIVQYATLEAEVAGVVATIKSLIDDGTPAGDILVLAQRNVIGSPIYEKLVAENVPAHSYYAEAELDVEDAQVRFSKLKLFIDRKDRVALRWLLGREKTDWRSPAYKRLRDHCDNTSGLSPWQALEQLANGTLAIPHTGSLIAAFNPLAAEMTALGTLPGLKEVIDVLLPEGLDGLRDLRQLAVQTLEATGAEPNEFIKELNAAITKPEVPSEVTEVRIMSLHKSKGLSSSVTIIAGCVQGLLPRLPEDQLSDAEKRAQMEEQRRLFYVGITRVKAIPEEGKVGRLILTYSRMMPVAAAKKAGIQPASTIHGNAYLIASQFLNELGPTRPQARQG